jgi:signal transduction histidine kinase/CheY-like chemotaxis protein
MPASIIAKYFSDGILDEQNSAVAITDRDQKLIWFNNSFKKSFGPGRLKGESISKLFKIPSNEILKLHQQKKSTTHTLPDNNLIITPLFAKGKKNKLNGYMLELFPGLETKSVPDTGLIEDNSVFQNELQKLLILLVKETSLDLLAEEILTKCTGISNADYGFITLINDKNKLEFKFLSSSEIIKNKNEVEKTIRTDFKFITKWLAFNRRSLLAVNESKNIGFNLTQSLASKSIIVSPCFFDDVLLATLIIGKRNADFSTLEISRIEQFTTLLTFAISNIRTRELNTALESRLLQAQKLETIGKLSSGMAHDFSNLLSSIFGSLNLLRKRVEPSESVDRLIDNIENCSVRARDLTKGLLSFGKPTPKRKELVKPVKLLNEISKVITQTFPASIKFSSDVDSNLYDILGNGTEIYQVLLNLCINAKEATSEKGNIKLSAVNITIDNKNIVNFPLLKEGNYVRFSVSDNGTGIEEENLTRIFEPYFSTKSKDTGSGLGLYVTYGIIKAHNGFIDVSSKAGEGTTFDVFIPAFEPPKEKKTIPADQIILLADDEPMLSDLLAELLESNGYNVIKVGSGEEALRVLTEEIKVNLAIIDYNMPEMTGIETIAEIRKLNLNFPIILSTGSMKVDDDPELEKFKIESWLQKPYEFETMLSTIKKLI